MDVEKEPAKHMLKPARCEFNTNLPAKEIHRGSGLPVFKFKYSHLGFLPFMCFVHGKWAKVTK